MSPCLCRILSLLNFTSFPTRRSSDLLTHPRSSTELTEARSYLIQTASPGYTMAKQGSELAIERLHPEFAIRLTKALDRKSTRLNSSHRCISYAVFCLKKKTKNTNNQR